LTAVDRVPWWCRTEAWGPHGDKFRARNTAGAYFPADPVTEVLASGTLPM